MNAYTAPDCVLCKTAPAALFLIFTTVDERGASLPYCDTDAFEVAPVLVAAGYEITLSPATQPPGLLLCEYGECPRLAKRGKRMCADHLRTLEEVYAGKQSGAGVDQVEHKPAAADVDQVAAAAERSLIEKGYDALPGELFGLPPERTRGGYDR